MGHLTGMAWRWANDAERFRVDFKTYEFIGYQRSTTVYYVRTDVPPGIKVPTDIVKAQGLVSGGLGPDNAKDLLIRLGLELLGVPHKHVTSYRSSATARLALQQGEINFYSESPPSYRSVVHPGIVKEGLAIPVWHDPENEGGKLIASKQVSDLGIRALPRVLPDGQRRAAVRDSCGMRSTPSGPSAARCCASRAAAGRAAGCRRSAVRRGAAAEPGQGLCGGGDQADRLRARIRDRRPTPTGRCATASRCGRSSRRSSRTM